MDQDLEVYRPLYPYRLLNSANTNKGNYTVAKDLIVNPRIGIQSGPNDYPEFIRPFIQGLADERITNFFQSQDSVILWVADPVTHMIYPYPIPNVPEAHSALLNRQIDSMGVEAFQMFRQLRAIYSPSQLVHLGTEWRNQLLGIRKHLLEAQYGVLSCFMHPWQIGLIDSYFQYNRTYLGSGDTQVSNRLVIHNNPFMRWWHHQLFPIIQSIVPESIKPSYCYTALYHSEADLPIHSDRDQCIWNASLMWSLRPHSTRDNGWSIWVKLNGQDVEIPQEPGDMVIYRGKDIKHWRNPLKPGAEALVTFFHFVPSSYQGELT